MTKPILSKILAHCCDQVDAELFEIGHALLIQSCSLPMPQESNCSHQWGNLFFPLSRILGVGGVIVALPSLAASAES